MRDTTRSYLHSKAHSGTRGWIVYSTGHPGTRVWIVYSTGHRPKQELSKGDVNRHAKVNGRTPTRTTANYGILRM